MPAFDNLFAARSYESIGSDYEFLELFSSRILEAVKASSFRNKVTVFRSGPGGGKTSLLRLFGPGPLRTISGNRDVNREVYGRLVGLGALTGEGPAVLSVYHRLDSYEALPAGARGGDAQTLFTLVGARLVMKWLAGILSLKDLGHDQMDRIKIGVPRSGKTLPGSPIPCNGKELYDWAARTEEAICLEVGGLEGQAAESIPRFRGLAHIHIMAPGHVTVNGEKITAAPLIALDDLHRLSGEQRRTLIEHVCEERYPAPVWLAERLDVLTLQDFFRGINGREYDVVQLEEHWEDRGTAFESFARSISEKRIQKAGVDFKIASLPSHLDGDAALERSGAAGRALKKIQGRVRARSRRSRAYDGWIHDAERSNGLSNAESLLLWKALEIKIARDERRGPPRMRDVPLPPSADGGDDKRTREAAEMMLSDEFELPYYWGFKKIVALATFNIELFLELGSEMMERLVAQLLKDPRDCRISALEQEKIVKDVARRHWDDIERINRNGGDVRRFLESFCEYARGENTPSAPYAPGVTGFGVTGATWSEIRGGQAGPAGRMPGGATTGAARLEIKDGHAGDRGRLADVLHTCLAQNYLKIKNVRQGRKGSDPKMVLYLNRLLCANAGLPVGRGGWRPRSTGELVQWLGGVDGRRDA